MEPTHAPKPPAGESKSLHWENMKLGNREYVFEYRESGRGNRFLNVTDTHERNGKVVKSSVLVFEDQLEAFMDGLNRALDYARNNKKPKVT